MEAIKDQAIVLRRLDFSEHSQVLAIFTREHGKVRLIAKGVKRSTKTRFAAAIDLLEVGEVVIAGAHREKLAILAEWTQVRALSGLRLRLDRLYGAQYAGGLTAELTEDWDPHPALFDALASCLGRLDSEETVLVQVIGYQRDLLREIGSAPVLDHCVGCRRPLPATGALYFSSFEGGVLCRDCEGARTEKYEVPRVALPWLCGGRGETGALREAYLTLDYHLAHLMGKRHPLAESLLAACRRSSSRRQ